MALKRLQSEFRFQPLFLAVPSYGAMALKRFASQVATRYNGLAVPSYGAMALKPAPFSTAPLMPPTLQSPPTGRWP